MLCAVFLLGPLQGCVESTGTRSAFFFCSTGSAALDVVPPLPPPPGRRSSVSQIDALRSPLLSLLPCAPTPHCFSCLASGAGKSTLFNCLSGKAQSGSYDGWLGVNGQAIPFESLFWFTEIGLVPQFPVFPPHMSVEEYLFTSCGTVLPAAMPEIVHRVQDAMQLCGLEEVADRGCGVLSGGQKKKVSIARALLQNPSVLFLDEPLSGLDSASAINICQVLRRLAQKGRAICLVVHQPLAEVLEAADLLWLVVDGRTAYFGELSESLTAHFEMLNYRDRACRFRNLSETLNFVTLKPATWDAISYNAAAALEFMDPRICLHDATGLAQQWAGTPAAWVLEQLLATCKDHHVPAVETKNLFCTLDDDDDAGSIRFRNLQNLGQQMSGWLEDFDASSSPHALRARRRFELQGVPSLDGPKDGSLRSMQAGSPQWKGPAGSPKVASVSSRQASGPDDIAVPEPQPIYGKIVPSTAVNPIPSRPPQGTSLDPTPTRDVTGEGEPPFISDVSTLWDVTRFASTIVEDVPMEPSTYPAGNGGNADDIKAKIRALEADLETARRQLVLSTETAQQEPPDTQEANADGAVPWEDVRGREFVRPSVWQCASALFERQPAFGINPVEISVWVVAALFGGAIFLQLDYSSSDLREWVSSTALLINVAVVLINVSYAKVFYIEKERLEQDLHNGFAQQLAFMLMLWTRVTASTTVNSFILTTILYWMVGLDATADAYLKSTLAVVLLSHAWIWISLASYTAFPTPIGDAVPPLLQGVMTIPYLFIHPDRLPVWLKWTFTISPFRWGIQGLVMAGLDVVFQLDSDTSPYIPETEALNLFYAAGIGTESAVFCLMILFVWWAVCLLLVGCIFYIRFRTSILQPARILRTQALQAKECEVTELPMETEEASIRRRLSSPKDLQRDGAVVMVDEPAGEGKFIPDLVREKRSKSWMDEKKRDAGLEQAFARVAKGGHMGVAEFAEYLNIHIGQSPSREVVTRLFRGLDLCSNGRIDVAHFKHFVDVHTYLYPETVAQVFFRVYDAGDTDMINEAQLVDGLRCLLVPPPGAAALSESQLQAQAKAIMAFVDVKGQGHFTVEDLEAACSHNLLFLQYCATLC